MPYRNLVFCFDGTWTSATDRKPGTYYSNVFKISENLTQTARSTGTHRHDQIRFYYPGIGTRAFGYEIQGGAFGKGYERALESAYIDLCNNYRAEDQIYVFGYSRGAIIAQAFCRVISGVGILHSDALDEYAKVWKVATDPKASRNIIDRSKLSATPGSGRQVVNFLGLFDPVFAGSKLFVTPEFKRLSSGAGADVPSEVFYNVVCLALDETRRKFLPFVWEKRNSAKLCQIWLPGVHGDIGGVNDNSIFGKIALLEMGREASRCGSISFRAGFLDELEQEVDHFVDRRTIVNVNNESNLIWRMLGAGWRTALFKKYGKFHPILKDIASGNPDINYKGKKSKFLDRYANYLSNSSIRWLE